MVTLLIDADIVAYKFSAASERKYNWGDGIISVAQDENYNPFQKAVDYVEEIKEKLGATDIIICLSDPDANFRKLILESYKGNRKGIPKPLHLMAVKDHLANTYPSYIRPTLEADDIMGILSTHPTLVKGKKIIVSSDKDLQQIVGYLYNPDKDKDVRLIAPSSALRFHMYQTLVGDTADNYKGCPRIGDIKANRILDDAEQRYSTTHPTQRASMEKTYWLAIVDTYEDAGLDEVDALVQAQVSRMLTHTDYDFKNREVILWQPPLV